MKGRLIAVVLWVCILSLGAVAYKFLVDPYLRKRLASKTGTKSHYKFVVKVAADSFSGYAVLRSDRLRDDLQAQGIKLEVVDDQADYKGRIKALKDRDVQMAVFTIDSYLKAGGEVGEFPASIIMVIDETKGADGVVVFKNAVKNLNDLNDPNALFVLTPNSPSEFLARILVAHLNLPNLPAKWWSEANGAQEVYRKFRSGSKTEKRAYVLWQPYISRALAEEGATVLFDSSKISGYIIDILLAERRWLKDNPEPAKKVTAAYLRAAYSYLNAPNGMIELVKEDAKRSGAERLSDAQANDVVSGVWWKNTLENYAHFGLGAGSKKVPYLEDMIGNILEVLVKTGALPKDPLDGQYSQLFYPEILKQLQAEDFHPGRRIDIVSGVGTPGAPAETIREEKELSALTEQQWQSISPVGTLRVEPIGFQRGTANLTVEGRRGLETLGAQLKSWPQYYLVVVGHTLAEGDAEANRLLANQRADSVVRALVDAGVSPNRLKAKSEAGAGGQVVEFVLGQLPY